MINLRLFDGLPTSSYSYKDDMTAPPMLGEQLKLRFKKGLIKGVRIAFDCLVVAFLIAGPTLVYGG